MVECEGRHLIDASPLAVDARVVLLSVRVYDFSEELGKEGLA